jgi:hypothetical protein
MSRPLVPRLVFALLAAAPAGAGQITFDDIPPANANTSALSEEYAHLGVHFRATDDGSVWSGLSSGDPGGWGLEGSAGTAFVGFNGSSYALTAAFDVPVRNLEVDVARATGSMPGDSVVMRGYLGGVRVEEATIVLGDEGQWSTVALAAEVDEVEWVGLGTYAWWPMHPFGLDHVRWDGEPSDPVPPPPEPEPVALEVTVDIRPGSSRNPVNPFARGVLPVALLGSETLDVTQVDAATLAFGPEGAPSVHTHVGDLDGDGHPDLLTLHRVPETGIALGDTEACLSGATLDGTPFSDCDAIQTVPARPVAKQGQRGAARGRR